MPEENEDVQGMLNAISGLDEFAGERFEVTPPAANDQPPVENQNVIEGNENEIPPITNEEVETNELTGNNNTESTEENEEVITNPIFGDTNLAVKENQKPSDEKPEDKTDYSSILNEVGVKDVNELKERFNKLTSLEEEYSSIKSQYDAVENNLQALPPELYEAMKASLKGEDWRGIVNSTPKVDFKKQVNEVDSKSLVEAFMPNKFSQEDWEEYNDEDGDASVKKAIDMAIEISKDKFTAKQKEFKDSTVNEQKKIEQYQEMFVESAKKATSYVKTALPGVSDTYLNTVSSKITKEGIVGHFYNSDGTLKETAVLDFLKTTPEYEKYQKIQLNNAVKEERNRLTIEMLERGDSTPRTRSNKNSSKDEIRPEVKKQLQEAEELFSK